MGATVEVRVRRVKKPGQKGPTFRITQALPQGMTSEEAKQLCREVVEGLAESKR